MGKFIDLRGQRFGRLTVVERVETLKAGETRWLCRCSCGRETITTTGRLRRGTCRSCGCLHSEAAKAQGHASMKHGATGSRLHRIWTNMKTRCRNKKNSNYPRWGGRGIAVCDEWLNDFSAFQAWALANGYREGLTLDRIDNNGGYSPENCRWTTAAMQANNRRSSRRISCWGETHTLGEWSRKLGISACTLFYRLRRLPPEKAFMLPVQDPRLNLKGFRRGIDTGGSADSSI